MMDDDLLFSNSDPDVESDAPTAAPWKVLIIDDDREVHAATRLALSDVVCLDRPLSFLSVYSAREAHERLPEMQDIAVILLDVVMESDDAGLQLVRYVREELKWAEARIILRTGQPGSVPERHVITQYDINDYKSKAELTESRLFTTVVAGLRSYRHLVSLEESRRGLRKIIDAAASLQQTRSMQLFAEGVLLQLTAILGASSSSVLCAHRQAGDNENILTLATSGRFSGLPSSHLAGEDVLGRLQTALEGKANVFAPGYAALYLKTPNGREVVVYVESDRPFSPLEISLLEMFGYNISVGYDNLELYEQLLEANATLERRVAERTRELGESEAKLRVFKSAVDYSSAAIVITDPDGIIEYANPAISRNTLYDWDMLVGQHVSVFRSGRMPSPLFEEIWAEARRGQSWRGELLNRRRDGGLYWEDVSLSPVCDDNGRITHFISIRDDISERKRMEDELRRHATTDPLTGVLNRRSFMADADLALSRCRANQGACSVIMLDIDHFKNVNDTYGHSVGDQAIRSVASIATRLLEGRGFLGRLGGEEFACVLPETGLEAAISVAERLRLAVADAAVTLSDAKRLSITISLGVAAFEGDGATVDLLLQQADCALYDAKLGGRNCSRPFAHLAGAA
jgi:diguanylate cyclase (GGDEF)-like protein/PAS domain S-box-containing protein